MSKLSVDISASARNGVSRILHGLDISNQKEIAEQLKVDPSTITRLKTDKKNNGLNEIEMFCELLSLLGLKVVPLMGFLFLYLLDFNYDLKLNQVARRQTSPPEILLEMIVICLCHLHIN
ncbi:MAG: hypothetical protein ACRC69_09995 [Acinetobacter baumannii]